MTCANARHSQRGVMVDIGVTAGPGSALKLGRDHVRTGRGGADQHRHEDPDRQCPPIGGVHTDVPEEQHHQPGRGEGRDQEDQERHDQSLEHDPSLFVPGTIGPGPLGQHLDGVAIVRDNPREGDAMSDQGDIEEVRAEVDRLKDEVERLEAKPEKRRRTRRIFAVVFVVIAVIWASAATPGLWARRTVYDTNRWVAVVGPLASDPAIQQALATKLTTSVFDALDVQSKVQAALQDAAPRLEFIAGPITNGVQGFVQDQVLKIVSSSQFQQFWTQTIQALHPQVIAVLNGTSEIIQQQGNQVVFNYLPLVNQALSQMSQTLSGIIGHQITLPAITPDTVPSQAIAA